jgi:predicted TIM-barrel fold metal-dependent hydrolase
MSGKQRLFDADGHIFEKDAEIFEYLDPPFAGRQEVLRTGFFPPGDNWNRGILLIVDAHRNGAAPQAGALIDTGETRPQLSPERWLEVLDRAGIEGTVLFPTRGLAHGKIREPEWAVALARAYNTWLYEKYTKTSPRLNGMALLPVQSVPDAVAELRRAVTELGAAGGLIVAGARRPLGDPYYYPIYEAAQELDTVLAIHAGGPGTRFEMFDRAIEARCLGHPTSLMIEMTSLMFSGVFDRFPRLRFAFYEGGVAWIMFLLERMQEAYGQWSVQAPDLKCEPKEHLTSGRIYFHCELDEEILPHAARVLGDEVLLYASDFPHLPPRIVLHDLEHFGERTDLSPETRQRILGENARRLYRIAERAPVAVAG